MGAQMAKNPRNSPLSREFRVALPWELYTDDLGVIAEID